MYRARVVTEWVPAASSVNGRNHPLIDFEYTLAGWEDVTGQANIVPEPNEYTVEITCEDAVMAAIEADPDYEVQWSEEIVDDTP